MLVMRQSPRLGCTRAALGFAIAVVLSVVGAAEGQAQQRANPFANVKSWGYQLRNLGPEQQGKIAASPYDLVIIDDLIGSDDEGSGGTTRHLTRPEVEAMKKKSDGSRRLVVNYLSIGETENYRDYWKPEWNKSRPAWMSKENKEWKGNYLVQYWNPVWQNIVFGSPEAYADKVLAEGFDGFYFDRVDAYYYFGDNKQARERMVDFVTKLSAYVRQKKPDVAILVQNAEELLEYPQYVAAVDGIAKESPIYGIKGADVLNPQSDITETAALLNAFQSKGKKVFVVEYLRKPNTIADAIKRAKDQGWVLYMGPRGLAQLSGATPESYTAEQVKATEAWSGAPAQSPAEPSATKTAKKK